MSLEQTIREGTSVVMQMAELGGILAISSILISTAHDYLTYKRCYEQTTPDNRGRFKAPSLRDSFKGTLRTLYADLIHNHYEPLPSEELFDHLLKERSKNWQDYSK